MAEEKKPSVLTEIVAGMLGMDGEKVAKNRAEQPAFGAQIDAMVRQGREDLWNSVVPPFPNAQATREAGTPGNPTAQMTTEALTDKEVDLQTDMPKAQEASIEAPKAQEAANDKPKSNDADIRNAILGGLPPPQMPQNDHQRDTGRGGR